MPVELPTVVLRVQIELSHTPIQDIHAVFTLRPSDQLTHLPFADRVNLVVLCMFFVQVYCNCVAVCMRSNPHPTSKSAPHLWHQNIHRSDSFLIIVELHIKGLDVLRVVVNNRGFLVDLLTDVALVLGAKVHTPLNVHLLKLMPLCHYLPWISAEPWSEHSVVAMPSLAPICVPEHSIMSVPSLAPMCVPSSGARWPRCKRGAGMDSQSHSRRA